MKNHTFLFLNVHRYRLKLIKQTLVVRKHDLTEL